MKHHSVGNAILLFVLVAFGLFALFGCSTPITAIQQSEPEPTLVGLWKHDSRNLQIEFHDGGTYLAKYASLEGYGQWRPIELENVFEFSNDTLCRSASAYYSVIFTPNGMRMFGEADSCAGRLERWTGSWTRRW